MRFLIWRGLAASVLATTCLSAQAVDLGTVMLTGDSLTGGSSNAGCDPYAYRQSLAVDLVAAGATFQFVGPLGSGTYPLAPGVSQRHAGFGGWSIGQMLAGNPGNPGAGTLSGWLSAYTPDTVVFSGGHNDIWDVFWNTNFWGAQAQANFNSIMPGRYNGALAAIFAQDPTTKVVFAAPPKMLDTVAQPYRIQYSQAMRDLIQTTAATWKGNGYDVTFVDWWTPSSLVPGVHFGSDNVHWNQAGGQMAADLAAEALLPVPEPVTVLILLGAGLGLSRRRVRVTRVGGRC